MSLYNMIMRRNPFSPYLLAVLGITIKTKDQYPLGRIRDVYTNDAADRIFVLHRNYGESGQPVDDAIAKHPNFIKKSQASKKDTTYWVYEFSVPDDEQLKAYVKQIAEMSDNTPCMEQYEKAVDDFADGKDNEMTRRMVEVGKKVMGPLMDSFKEMEEKKNPETKVVSTEDGSVVITPLDGKRDTPDGQ